MHPLGRQSVCPSYVGHCSRHLSTMTDIRGTMILTLTRRVSAGQSDLCIVNLLRFAPYQTMMNKSIVLNTILLAPLGLWAKPTQPTVVKLSTIMKKNSTICRIFLHYQRQFFSARLLLIDDYWSIKSPPHSQRMLLTSPNIVTRH